MIIRYKVYSMWERSGSIKIMVDTLRMNVSFLELLSLLDVRVDSIENEKQAVYPLVNKKQASKKVNKKSEVAEKTGNIEAVTPIS